MIKSQDIKKGTCIRMDGKLYFCIDFLHVKPGKGNTIMRTTLKDVVSGRVLERRFNIGEALEDVRVERRPFQYSYADGDQYHFLNQETWDDVVIEKDLITGVDFMKEGDVVEVVSDASTETILYAEMPVRTSLLNSCFRYCPIPYWSWWQTELVLWKYKGKSLSFFRIK